MKHFYFILTLWILWGCQSEERFEQVEELTSISSQSEISDLLLRLTQNPTAFDDFVDGSNAISLEFPFEVNLNSGSDFIISDFSDYETLIDEISNQTTSYTLSITFPTEISFSNYETLIVESESEYNSVINTTLGSSEINCLEFEFPINAKIFDAQNSLTDNRTLQNKAQSHNLIQSLKVNSGFYELNYPITIEIEGVESSLLSNTDLISAIENLDQSCFNPSLLNTESRLEDFIAFVSDGVFQITSFIDEDDEDLTTSYQDYRFTFNTNNSISIEDINSGESFSGTWEAEIDDGEFIFDLNFEDDNDELDELDEDWVVSAFGNPDAIVLFDEDNDIDRSLLTFEKL
ncbi:hypothetical protein [Psychroflexus tropicus]|uniref:hypothetical protein n=1 Tax=Psychroflexus tropicus TaxID=197345 RepID=UPI000368B139|nr:hypothetical protein [Psychroflexus tropicus]